MNLITLDFETYFDKEYSLKKLTTEEYVRDPRFKVHMVGLSGNGGQAQCRAPDKSTEISLVTHSVGAFLCHHAQFDGLILSHHYGIRPAFWLDTLSMARLIFPHAKSHSLGALAKMLGLPEKTVPYNDFEGVRDLPPDLYNRVAAGCANDVELTYAIFKKLLPMVPKEELQVMDFTIRMFTEPAFALDKDRLEAYLSGETARKEELLSSLGVSGGDLRSADKFAALLQKLGVQPPTKPSPRHPEKSIFAFAKTDTGMKELLEHDDERIQQLAAARLGQKSTLGETRARRLLGMAERGPLCVYLRYCGAHTTRWSGGDSLNFQNFPRGSEIRKSLLAPRGHRLCIIDLSQIECRVLNWLAGQRDVLDLFAAGEDVYCAQASRALGTTITKEHKRERFIFKTAELGLGYGMGAEKFNSVLLQQGIEADAASLVKIYRASHPMVVRLWKEADTMLRLLYQGDAQADWGCMKIAGKYITLPGGVPLDYSNLRYSDNEFYAVTRTGPRKIYGAKLVENVVQALSRLVLSQAMIKIARKYKILVVVHDEVVYLAKDDEAEEALVEGTHIMKITPPWAPGLPLDAEGLTDVRYSK